MKKLIRRIVAKIVKWTDKHCCTTYGDKAELSSGPCGRCVGRAIHSPPASECIGPDNPGAKDIPSSANVEDRHAK